MDAIGAGATPLTSRPASTGMNDQTGRPAWSPAGVAQNDTVNWPQQPINQPEARPDGETAVSRGLAAAIEHHQNRHERHRNRHEHQHDHGRRHEHERS